MLLAEKCGSLNTLKLCCFDSCCNSGTLQSMIHIDTPIGSPTFKKDKSKSSCVIHSSYYILTSSRSSYDPKWKVLKKFEDGYATF